ncbi:MAG TPA: UDP-galactose-lipid carrier transferase [Solirubrobacteraceae bacterium]|nr:UDP-galactose-lipid carrier transferase [Solirubrobacteraceae bacterium]
MGRLDALDLKLKLSADEEARRLETGGARLAHLRLTLAGLLPFGDGTTRPGPALCLVFEGWDASGKGGAIKRLSWPLDPRAVRYSSYGPPTADELRHHYLWRFTAALPGWGDMTVYDRSWYGRVLVERVEALATEKQWRRAYDEINGFERGLTDGGTIIAKFWLHVSPEEQLERFLEREKDPIKQYKLTDADWRNRERRADYEVAVEEMLERTDTKRAPWVLVEANSKKWARVKVMESTVAVIEAGMRHHGFEPPAPLHAGD